MAPSTSISADVAAFLRPGETVFVEAGAGEPAAFRRALAHEPDRAAGVTFRGVFVPGLNDFDYAALHPLARAEGSFAVPAFRESFEAGRYLVRPMHYHETARFIAENPVDLAVVQVSRPGPDGLMSFGLNADFAPLAAARAKRVVAYMNHALPATGGEPGLAREAVDHLIEVEDAPPDFPPVTPAALNSAIAHQVAALARDGDVIQIGLGKLPAAILRALRGHRGLRFHTGLISDEVVDLAEAGALARDLPIVTGCAMGTARLHGFSADRRAVSFRSVLHTHAPDVIAQKANFLSINSVLAVDLLGQANGEMLNGRYVSGVGGLLDFLRGARASAGGRSVLALPASAGRHSRIVPMLGPGAVTVPRADIDIVASEHGVARLRHLPLDARAEALIAIAAPEHRGALTDAWRDLRQRI